MLQFELETAISLARLAGKRILEHYEAGVETENKIGADMFNEPVTIADREASRIIVDGLVRAFPNDGILSEEETDDLPLRLSKDRVWIIDPIDGTAGFIDHDGDFCVQIGLAERGIAVLGVVYQPWHDILSYATSGEGSFTVIGGQEPMRRNVSTITDLRQSRMAISRHHPSHRLTRIIKEFGVKSTINRGSVGLKVSLLVDRSADVYVSPGARTKLWDTCAPQIILEEAGGRFTDMFGLELRYDTADLQNRNGLLATNSHLHERAVDRLAPLLREFGRVPHKPTH
ncbi:MAG: 3'(2'),5'-bisphosphate nucleotidase CysQ [Pyrinomonadaceae bacterium]